MGAIVRWAALVAALACFSAARADPPPDPNIVQWDPTIRHGVLPNGLRYAVMRNATPSGGVSIRLGIDVGALDEQDDELGAAHFLEHMAFGGSRAQLQADVEKTFSDAGVAFGRDRNAQTGLSSTTYEIDLPHGDEAALDLGFRWLRQVADGARLTPETVDRERGVILAERETRLSALSQATDRVEAFQAPGGRMAKAPIIGSEASIRALTAAQLQSFYERWYQPANAAVVVVGDEPVEALEAKVKATFGDWRAPGPPSPPRASQPFDFARGPDVLPVAAPNLPSIAAACRMTPPADGDQMSRLRRAVGADVWRGIAEARLDAAARTPGSGFIAAQVLSGDYHRQAQISCVTVQPMQDAWEKALATAGALTADLARNPPTDDELEGAIKSLRGTLRGELYGAATRSSGALADDTLSALLEGEVEPSPAERLRAFDVVVEGMTAANAQAAFRRDWSGAGPLIDVISPMAADPAVVRQAWLSGDHGAGGAAAAPAPAATAWAYGSFGKPGKVARRDVIAGADFVRITFANGAVMNFKHTDFEADQVSVRLSLANGQAGLAPADLLAATLGSIVLPLGGLAHNSYADIGAQFRDEGIRVAASLQPHDFVLSEKATPATLGDGLEVMTAYVSDPGFRDLDTILSSAWGAGLRTARGYPAIVAQEALFDAVAPDNPLSITAAVAKPPTAADVVRVLKPLLTQSPLELTVVGDVDENVAVEAAAATIGALAPRRPAPADRADAWFLRFPAHLPALVTATHDGPAEKALVAMVWPLWVAEPARRPEEYAAMLAERVLSDALMRQIRGELGKAYSPAAATVMPDHADQGYLIAETEVAAEDVDQARAAMAAVAVKVAKGDFTDQDLENVRKPFLAGVAKQYASNDFLARAISGSSADDSGVKELPIFQGAIAAVTPAQVRKAAADWMTQPPIVVVATGRAPQPARQGPKP